MEEVFKQCYGCFDASFFPKCRLSRRAMQNKWRGEIIVVFYFGSSAVRDYLM